MASHVAAALSKCAFITLVIFRWKSVKRVFIRAMCNCLCLNILPRAVAGAIVAICHSYSGFFLLIRFWQLKPCCMADPHGSLHVIFRVLYVLEVIPDYVFTNVVVYRYHGKTGVFVENIDSIVDCLVVKIFTTGYKITKIPLSSLCVLCIGLCYDLMLVMLLVEQNCACVPT